MKWCGSAGGGGAAWDVELKRCRLAGIVFFGAIMVTDGSKSETKCTQEAIGNEGAHQKRLEGKSIRCGYL